MCVCVSASKRARASDEAHIRDARNAILVSLLPSSVCMCWVHCTMRLFPVFLNLSYYLLCVCRAVAVVNASFSSDFTIRLWVPTNQVHGDGKAHENTVSLQLKMPNHTCCFSLSFSLLSIGDCLMQFVSLSQRIPSRVDIFHLLSTSSTHSLSLHACVRPPMPLPQRIKYVEKNLYQL